MNTSQAANGLAAKPPQNLAAAVVCALAARTTVTRNGRERRMTKLDAMVAALVDRAADGEPRATQLVLQLVQAEEARRAETADPCFTEDDADVLQELVRRIRCEPPA